MSGAVKIEEKQIDNLAHLARLEFSAEEKGKLQVALSEVIEYMDKLKALDLSTIEPMTHVDDVVRPMREDVVKEGLNKEQAFRNAPSVNMGHFSIPKTVK